MKKLLYITASLSALALLFVLAHAVGNQPVNYQTQTAIVKPYVPPTASEVAYQVNMQRIKYGLPALADDPRLDASAMAHCQDMVTLNYWSHNRPDGTPPWHFFNEQGLTPRLAGENLAYGYRDASTLADGWMNSPEHKVNIVNPNYTTEGTAVCHSDNFVGDGPEYIEVQHFVGL